MLEYLKFFLLINNIIIICSKQIIDTDDLNTKVITTKNFMVWPNATIPFFIEPGHFDNEQALSIMTSLSMFAFKTCLKFLPVLEKPNENAHVMTFVNPNGIKRCKIDTTGHSVYKSHVVTLGYDCLKSPHIDMMIMMALGFPFEHNRLSRDLYINVLLENIDPSAVELFTKDIALPVELRAQPYDINSVMHFGERDYSKNGHKTISFKNSNAKQNRIGLTNTDIKKIEIVYGDECRNRDRMEKVELCQSFPGVVRKKRDVDTESTSKSLRVNPNITPPAPSGDVKFRAAEENSTDVFNSLKDLGVDDEAQKVVDQIFKLSAAALTHARNKYCNNSKNEVPTIVRFDKKHNADINGILELVNEYTEDVIQKALTNLTIFCEQPDSPDFYQRSCNWRFGENCRPTYRSTKSGRVYYSTNHKPFIHQSTNVDHGIKYSYEHNPWRSGNNTEPEEPVTESVTTPQVRRKREATEPKKTSVIKDKLQKEKMNVKEVTLATGKSTKNADGSKGDKRRYFERRGYKSTKNPNKREAEWAASDVSGEKGIDIPSDVSAKVIAETAEVNEPQTVSPPLSKGSGVIQETYNFGQKEKPVVKKVSLKGNIAKEMEKDESELEVAVTKADREYLSKTKSKSKLKIKDTFELMDKKSEKKAKLLKKKRAHSDVPETVKLTKLNKEFYNERRWPEGVIRYVISSQEEYDLDDMRARLEAVAKILKENTCVRLQEVTEDEAINYEDYLVLDTSPDYVTGRVGGQQHFGSIELFKGGQHKQHTAMMVMAMLGFYFEVSRHDRDKYIRVHMRHVRPDKLHHFEKIRDEATLDLPYDFKSATHPAWQFWRKIGKTGISTVATFKDRDPDGSVMRALGQHDQLLSDSDIIKINSIYGVECFTENEARRSSHRKVTSP